jgi:hypothetical protein
MEEMKKLLTMPATLHVLETFGIKADLPTNFLIQMLGFDTESTEKTQTSFEEVLEACKRLCGSKSDLRSFFVQNEIHRGHSKTRKKILALESKLGPFLADIDHSEKQHPASPIKTDSDRGPTSVVVQKADPKSPSPAHQKMGQTSPPRQTSPPPPAAATPPVPQQVKVYQNNAADGMMLNTAHETMASLEARQDQIFKAIDDLKKISKDATAKAQVASKPQYNGNGFPTPMKPAISLDNGR